MVFQVAVQMSHCFFLLELIGATNTKAQQGVQIVRVNLMSLLKRQDSIVILIILLIQLSHQSPGFSILCVFSNFSL